MALSGSARGSGTPRLRIDWSATQSVANNRSTVTAKVWLEADYYINFSATKYGSVTVNGVTRNFSTSSRHSGTGEWLLTTQTFTVNHNSDGSKSFNFSAKYDIKITYSGSWLNTVSASGSGTLNTIPRKSELSVSGWTLGNSIPLSYDIKYSGFRHDLVFRLRSNNQDIKRYDNVSSLPSSVTLSEDENSIIANGTPNSTTATVRVYLTTEDSSGNFIGQDYKDVIATIPASGRFLPTVDTVSISEAVAGLAAQFGGYVQNKSKLKLSMTDSGSYGSTIKSRRITANDQVFNSSSGTTDILKSSGTNRITFETTDSRGRKASVAREISVMPYSNPEIKSLNAVRANADGTVNEDGTYAKVTVNGSISPVGNKNTKSFKIYYKKQSASTWSERTITVSGYTANTSVVIPGFDADSQYDIRFQVADYFTAISLDTVLYSTFSLINWHPSKRGMAFGGAMSRPEGIDFLMDSKFKEAPTIVAPTSTDEDGAFLRLRRLDESLLAFLATGAGGTGLKLHMYNGTSWTGYISIDEDGTINQNGVPVGGGLFGSNSNGEYFKFPNGLMICWRESTDVHVYVDNAQGGIYRGPLLTRTFPAAFVTPPSVNVSIDAGVPVWWVDSTVNGTTHNGYIHSYAPRNEYGKRFMMMAIGRWK
ncbi:DUF859 family phage minor structural protein [Bacillus subtilis]